jgi:hypothetical protein
MAITFRAALLKAMEATQVSISDIAAGSGVSYEQLKKIRQRPKASTNICDARAVARFFGVTLSDFLEDWPTNDRLER